MSPKRILVVGGGAAGLMAALFAAQGPHEVVILERMATPGRKILISGGGRCNVLPAEVRGNLFHTGSSANALKAMLQSWPLAAQERFWEEEIGLPLKLEEESGKLFPVSDRAADVLNGLLRAVGRRGATLRYAASVEGIEREEEPWRLRLADGRQEVGDAVIFATGGLSVPKTGSDGTGLRLVRGLGHTVRPLYPALTPLRTDYEPHHALAGVSKPVTLFAPLGNSLKKGAQRTRGFLFTHRGYSGPAVLDLSHHAVRAAGPHEQPLLVQWDARGPDEWEQLLREGTPTTPIRSLLRSALPDRLAELLLVESGTTERTRATLRREERLKLVELLTRYPLPYSGHEGYQKAEVTGGGVALEEVNPRTMESRLHPGLFLCGEMLDAFGPIGGYNFLWAWVTGRLAGLGAGC